MRSVPTLLVSASCVLTCAQDGTLDPSFGGDGIITTDIVTYSDLGLGILQQPDGKILCAGYGTTPNGADMIVARYNPDGTPDNTFAGDGTFQSSFGTDTRGRSIALQPDGKIIVCGGIFSGATSNDYILVRLNTDGTLDNTFGGGDGFAVLDFVGEEDTGYGCLVQPDGKILLCGKSVQGGGGHIGVARFNADGTLDPTFNGTGWSAPDLGAFAAAEGRRIALQPDGKIVACGFKVGNGGDWDALAERFNADGTLDASFANAGIFFMPLGEVNDYLEDVGVQADGKIVLGGSAVVGGISSFALVRLNVDGSFDTSFDGDGKAFTAIGTAYDGVRAILIQPDGKIIAAGQTATNNLVDFGVARFNSDGTLDNTFSGDGKTAVDIGGALDYGTFAALQSDGRILLCGYSEIDNDPLVVVRLNNTITGIGEMPFNPMRVQLMPNPAVEHTVVEFGLAIAGFVSADLLDAAGREIMVVMDRKHMPAGMHRASIDLVALASGAYTLVLRTPTSTTNTRVVKQ